MKRLIHCSTCTGDVKAYNPTVRELLTNMNFRFRTIPGVCKICDHRYYCLVSKTPDTPCFRPAIFPKLTVDKLRHIMEKDGIPFERIVKIVGTALRPMICDHCGKPINPPDKCTAITVIAKDQQYYRWEEEYMVITTERRGEA